MSGLNPQYLQLYRNYAKAMRDLGKARKRKRAYEAKKAARDFLRPLNKLNRRPVGAPVGYSFPSIVERNSASHKHKIVRRVDMGHIIGIVEFRAVPTIRPLPDPTANFDPNQILDNIEKKLFEKVYANYWHHRKVFFNFMRNQEFLNGVRNTQIKKYFEQAHQEAVYQANLQILGCECDETYFEQFEAHVAKACDYTLAIYRNTPKIKEPDPFNTNQFIKTDVPESWEVFLQMATCIENSQVSGSEGPSAQELVELINSIIPKLGKYQYLMK